MKRSLRMILASLAALLVAGLASAQTSTGTTQPSSTSASATAKVTADAKGGADVQALKSEMEKTAGKVSASAQAKAQARIDARSKQVDEAASKDGDQTVSTRLATQFHTTSQALMDEKQALGCSWGDLMIAHALDANAKTDATVAQLVQLHDGGMGWGRIAAGLGLNLGSVVSGVSHESSVATGSARADGKLAVMHGEGARAGAGMGLHAGLAAGKTSTSVGAGLHAGGRIGH